MKPFSVPIKKKVTKVEKDDGKTDETISYKIKFIDSARFMTSSLSNLADNLMEEIHKTKSKDCGCFLEYKCVKGNLIMHECLSWSKCNSRKLNEGFQKKFKNTFKFSGNNINKSILLLREGVYFMNIWMIGKKLVKQHHLKKRIL